MRMCPITNQIKVLPLVAVSVVDSLRLNIVPPSGTSFKYAWQKLKPFYSFSKTPTSSQCQVL